MKFLRKTSGLFAAIFLWVNIIVAQPYQNLVFEGGGIRGIAYVGALLELEERKKLTDVERVAGTSAGAITAALLAVGYTPEEMQDVLWETNIKRLADGRWFFIGGIIRMFKKYGWYRGHRFEKWMGQLIADKTGNADITFRQLHEMAADKNYYSLYITGTNLSKQKIIYFSHETFPDMRIVDAVRISMGIPLYYKAVFLDENGKVVSDKEELKNADVYIDGGTTAIFPIRIFDGEDSAAANPFTLGFRLDRPEQIEYDKHHSRQLAPYEINKFSDYIKALYSFLIENLNRPFLTPDDWDRTVSISTLDISPRVKRLSYQQKSALVESGRQGVRDYFENKAAPGADTLSLQIGEEVVVQKGNERLAIKLEDVLSDSRCPEGAVCIRAGEAVIQLKILVEEEEYFVKLATSPINDISVKEIIEGYAVDLIALQPHPTVDKPAVAKEDYIATLAITAN